MASSPASWHFIQYGLLADMAIKYGGGKCAHSNMPITPIHAPACSQHHVVFGQDDKGNPVTCIRLIRSDGNPDIIISRMNKQDKQHELSSLVQTVKSSAEFRDVLVPEFAKTVTSLENFHQFFHQMARYPQICAKYGIKFLVKKSGCVLVKLKDVPTLERVVEEVESRAELSITSFTNVTYADDKLDAATLAEVNDASCK